MTIIKACGIALVVTVTLVIMAALIKATVDVFKKGDKK